MCRTTLTILGLAIATGCGSMTGIQGPASAGDVHSFARPDEVRVTHIDLDLTLDFEAERILGVARLTLDRSSGAGSLVLDTRGLSIDGVTGDDQQPRKFQVGAPDPILGSALTVVLADDDEAVTVRYRTQPDAEALQWLAPEQTTTGQPFLYTQGQAILTRTWIPVQDSPGVRVTFDAVVRAPEGLTVVMAAEQLGQAEDGSYRFRMPQAIPPYLLALACGELEFRPLGERCGVWAEPSVVEAAAREFEDTPDMLASCERLFGPYRWGRYDVLILPPAFPFGGMENPRLTFATPTILAGDKSLVALIAHELAHSWSGNLVTNATWRDFWLNEGFTVYLEQRIMEEVFGKRRAEMEILIGLQGLDRELEELPPGDQVLHIDLTGRNPDDGMTAIPYDKGAAFLRALELRFGRPRFDAFLADYFAAHAFRSITTEDFLTYLDRHLLQRHPDLAEGLDIASWVRAPGLPADAPRPASAAFAQVSEAASRWLTGVVAADHVPTESWTTHEWLHFLAALPEDLGVDRLTELDAAFGLTEHGNSEILAAWLEIAVRRGYEPAMPAVEEFLLGVGRRKFLKPLYRALVARDAERAASIYARARPRYHAVSVRTLDEIVGWRGE